MPYPSGELFGEIVNPRLRPKERLCLKCDEKFMSEGRHNARCGKCNQEILYGNDKEADGPEPVKLHYKILDESFSDLISQPIKTKGWSY